MAFSGTSAIFKLFFYHFMKKDVAEANGICSMSTILYFRDGQKVYEVVGANLSQIVGKLLELIKS
jgi:hypothetical protein